MSVNLFTLKSDFLAYAQHSTLRGASSLAVTDAQIFRYFTAAYRFIQSELGVPNIRDTTIDLAANQMEYTLPDTLAPFIIQSVRAAVKEPAAQSSGTRLLQPRSMGFFQEHFNISNPADTAGDDPLYWTIPPPTSGDARFTKIWIAPAPTYSRTDGLIIVGGFGAGQLTRIYQQTTLKAEVTNDNAVVTISGGSLAVGLIFPGWEFGLIRGTLTDGQTITDNVPMEWIRIAAVTTGLTPQLTLVSPWLFNNDGPSNFIAAPVPLIEEAVPGKTQEIAMNLALSYHFKVIDPFRSEQLMAAARRQLAAVPYSENAYELTTSRPWDDFNFLTEK